MSERGVHTTNAGEFASGQLSCPGCDRERAARKAAESREQDLILSEAKAIERSRNAEKDAERLAEALRFCTSAYGRDRFGTAIVPLRAMDKGEVALRAHEALKGAK